MLTDDDDDDQQQQQQQQQKNEQSVDGAKYHRTRRDPEKNF